MEGREQARANAFTTIGASDGPAGSPSPRATPSAITVPHVARYPTRFAVLQLHHSTVRNLPIVTRRCYARPLRHAQCKAIPVLV